ncbi:GET complex subunit Get2/sif1 [Abortiporus biennis]
MSSAAARAEARRKAILSRGGDRLAKLTNSGRADDAAYKPEDPPLAPLPVRPLEEFVGEQSSLPTPPLQQATPPRSRNVSESHPASSPFNLAGLGNNAPDPSVWSEEQQKQFLSALMGGVNASPALPSQRITSPDDGIDTPSGEDPLAALMSSLVQQQQAQPGTGIQSPFGTGFAQPPAPPKPKTTVQRVMPLIHILAAWLLLAYFVLWKEPEVFDVASHGSVSSLWRRWAELGWKSPTENWGVQTVPFFWAFTTLTIVLHSWRIFSGLDRVQPPTLLAFALPHLPSPLPSIILNGMKYWQIAGVFFDDIAGVLVAIGLLIWVARWIVA